MKGGRTLRNAISTDEAAIVVAPQVGSSLKKNGDSVFPAELFSADGDSVVTKRWKEFVEKSGKTLQHSMKKNFELSFIFASTEEARRVWARVPEESRKTLLWSQKSTKIEGEALGSAVEAVLKATLFDKAAFPRYFYVDEFFAALIVQRAIRTR